ncbi:MAG: transglycosylase SLT domain-containing protein [Bacteroidales bacterium]|nr:transglycosylase SLT domain-containing protein [Bacteroidales bacterium]
MTSYVDERSDPVKSTEAACQYLKYLYDNFQDWNLALAAYNGGIAVVNEAIEKSGGERDYWKIRPWLSEETRGYVPAFIAVNYVMNYYHDYQIVPESAPFQYDDLGFVHIGQSISFQQLGAVIDVPVETLRWLNPIFLKDYIPVIEEPVEIVIPRDKVLLYFEKRHLLVREKAPPVASLPTVGETKGREALTHTVKNGEFFHRIAMDYGVRVEDVQKWNNMRTRHLLAGQKLIIWYKSDEKPLFLVQRSWMEGLNERQDN